MMSAPAPITQLSLSCRRNWVPIIHELCSSLTPARSLFSVGFSNFNSSACFPFPSSSTYPRPSRVQNLSLCKQQSLLSHFLQSLFKNHQNCHLSEHCQSPSLLYCFSFELINICFMWNLFVFFYFLFRDHTKGYRGATPGSSIYRSLLAMLGAMEWSGRGNHMVLGVGPSSLKQQILQSIDLSLWSFTGFFFSCSLYVSSFRI